MSEIQTNSSPGGPSSNPPYIGVDVLEPERLAERLSANPDLAHSIFRPGEMTYCSAQYNPIEHLAARFCAKEAVMKALGLDQWDPLDIEVIAGGDEVSLMLHDAARLRAESLNVDATISMSHVGRLAVAVALLQPKQTGLRGRSSQVR